MRQILFRGKRVDNGEWVEGNLVWLKNIEDQPYQCFIISQLSYLEYGEFDEMYQVFPEMVGQFTGLTDKNGKRIFEGDIFRLEDDIIGIVIFKDGSYRLELHGYCGTFTESGWDERGGGYGIIECEAIDWYCVGDMEIIGNIHDNGELLTAERSDNENQ